jgi:hypothetical protein
MACSFPGFPETEVDLMRTDSLGDTLWLRSYCAGFDHRGARALRSTPDGGFVVAASEVVIKTNANGDSMWARECDAWGVEVAPDGGYVVCGGGPRGTLTKLDKDGNVVWTNYYSCSFAGVIRLLSNGDFAVAGDAEHGSAYLARIATDGTLVWERTYPGETVVFDLAQMSDGGFCLVGEFEWSAPCVLRTWPDGTLRWQRQVAPHVDGTDRLGIVPTPDNKCIVASNHADLGGDGGAALFKVDENGGIGPEGFEAGAGSRSGARTVRRARVKSEFACRISSCGRGSGDAGRRRLLVIGR